MKNLSQIILRDNEFDRVQVDNFAGDERLMFLDLSRQRSPLTLESHSFAHIPSSTEFVFTGTAIPVIPSNAFQGRENVALDLSDLSIHTLAPHAFNGTFLTFFHESNVYSFIKSLVHIRRYEESDTRFEG